MIKVTLTPTPDPDMFLLAYECNGDTDELDELYATLATHGPLGIAWKDSKKFEVLIGKVRQDAPDPAGH